MTILTAKVAQVHFPVQNGQIEGLMDEQGRFYVAVIQASEIFAVPQKNSSRDIKSLLGERFQFLKLRTPLNPKPVNALTIDQFQQLIFELAFRGNSVAQDCCRALVGLSIAQLFHDAFNLEFGIESRQQFLREWQIARQRLRDVHTGMQQAAMRRHHPAWAVHDYMTTLIFGDTAEAARMKELVDPDADPTIGLNYQKEIDGMLKLTNAKRNYAHLRKPGTWQEQVERAVAKL